MSTFENLLQKWDKTLRKYNPRCYEMLYSPLSPDQIGLKLIDNGCTDENMKAWFGWKNGIDPDKDPDIDCMIFYFGVMPMSLDALTDTSRAYLDDQIWDASFIPLATDRTGLYLLFNNKPGEDYGKIYLYSVSLLFTEPVSYYDSLSAMLETAILDYEQQALVYDPKKNWLNEDHKKHREIAKRVNIHSDYWKLK
jgi:hypothetical protein